MKTMEPNVAGSELRKQDGLAEARAERSHLIEVQHERWAHCHVNWTAVWLGGLATFSMLLLFGLVGIAVGAHLIGPEHRIVDLHKMGLGAVIFSVCSAFFSSVLGEWVATKIAGILHSE